MVIYKSCFECAVMANICILLSVALVILSVSANSVEKNNYDEIDPVMDMLFSSEYDNDAMKPNENVDEKDNDGGERVIDGVPILYPDGVWKCGDCTNMDKMKLLHNEVYDQDINYDDYVEEYLNVEIQFERVYSRGGPINIESGSDDGISRKSRKNSKKSILTHFPVSVELKFFILM